MSTKSRKKKVHEKVDEAFKFYEKEGYQGHLSNPEIIEESKRNAEKLIENTDLARTRSFEYVASIASFLACEKHACSITLRMARDNSSIKLKMKHLQKAREVTGVKPKLNPKDWVDGIITTLKDRNIITKPGDAIKIKKQILEELPTIEEAHSPRYSAIVAAYRALNKSGYDLKQIEIKHIFHISEPILREEKVTDYDEIINRVNGFLKDNEETLYRAKDLVEILELDVKPSALSNKIRRGIENGELDLLRLSVGPSRYYGTPPFFGYSPTCGSGVCLESWCGSYPHPKRCRIGEKNPNLKLYNKT